MNSLGLDVGTHSVKALLLKKGWLGLRVLESRIRPVGQQSPLAVAREILDEWGDQADAITWSLDRRLLATREIHLPFTQARQIEDAFPYAAEGRIPMAIHEAMIDYHIDGEDPDGGSRVTVLAYPKEAFESRKAGLGPTLEGGSCYHVDAFANLNTLLAMKDASQIDGEVLGLLDVGATKACLDLVIDGISVFTRTFLTAGSKVDGAIAKEFDLESDEAETMKMEGLSRPNEDEDVRVVPRRLLAAVTPIYERLAQDLRHSLRAFHEKRPGLRLARLYLSGGSAQAPFLRDFLADHLGVDCRLLQPPILVKHQLRSRCAPVLLTGALGLALWGAGIGEVELDFVREREAPLLLRPSNLGLLAAIVFLICTVHFAGLRSRLAAVEERSGELERQIERQFAALGDKVEGKLGAASPLSKINEAIARARELSTLLDRKSPSPLAVLDAVARLIPGTRKDEILVDTVTVEGRNLQITGRADSYDTVDVLKLALEESPAFGEVSFGPMDNKGVSGPKRLRFHLDVRIESPEEGV